MNEAQAVDLWGRAQKTFLPFTPIKLIELFHGRQSEIKSVVNAFGMPGRHVVL